MKTPDLTDVAGLLGLALLSYGGLQVYPPLVFMIPGTVLLAIAIASATKG